MKIRFKRIACILMASVLTACSATSTSNSTNSSSSTSSAASNVAVVPDEEKPRVIITTDMEVDDLNSLIHMALYFNEIDVEGIIYTSSQYHFNGDGVHTLGEVTPDYLCRGERILQDDYLAETPWESEPDPEAANLTHYRDFDMGWIENLWDNEYREAYEHLSQNDPNYPTPEKLTSVTKYGNYQFEGDVREATDGSNLIKDALLDDDDRLLYISNWGGVNTTTRALMSIAEEYKDTDQWESIRDKVCKKARIFGTGQDNSWVDNKIPELYPDMVIMTSTDGYAGYGAEEVYSEVAEDPTDTWCYIGTAPDVNYTFHADWMRENIKENHGSLMAHYYTFLDGQTIGKEPQIYQFGLTGIHNPHIKNSPARQYTKYDFIGEGNTDYMLAFLNSGLNISNQEGIYGAGWGGICSYTKNSDGSNYYLVEDNSASGTAKVQYNYLNGSENSHPLRFLLAFQEDWAARAEWCVKDYASCNHAPVVTVSKNEISAKPGKAVTLEASVSDPDGNTVNTNWWYYPEGSSYSGEADEIRVWNSSLLTTGFTIPFDAKAGDYFNFIIQGRDDDASKPMTRYSQIIVRVE